MFTNNNSAYLARTIIFCMEQTQLALLAVQCVVYGNNMQQTQLALPAVQCVVYGNNMQQTQLALLVQCVVYGNNMQQNKRLKSIALIKQNKLTVN